MSFSSWGVAPTLPKGRALACAVMLVAATVARSAHADPESDAKDLFARGRELRSNNDCASAAPLFRKAWTVYPQGLGSLRNLAECEEQLGHFTAAKRAWLDLKRALVTTAADPKYEGWDKDADEAVARLKPKVGSFVVDVYIATPQGESLANDRSGIEILVNGESIGAALVGTPLERDPGTYRIRAQAPDVAPVEQVVTISPGDNPHVTLRVSRSGKGGAGGSASSDASNGRRTVGWILTGVGGAALIGSGVTFLLRQSALDELETQCPNYERQPCKDSLRSTVDRGQLMSNVSPVLLGAGIAAAGVGLVLVLTSPSAKAEKSAARSFRLGAGLGRVDATWSF